ncbi:MAG: alpha/beta hydrolase [Bacteroidetes bacterium]|nr:MAG: alpha/beta hydrolase [Bacteroidota bacterium]
MTVIYIPGLGFDQRTFQNLNLDGVTSVYLDWIEPLSQESIDAYAARMVRDIPWDQPVILIGHSFGGVISQHIAAQRKVALVVLVSSVRSRRELPFWFRWVRLLGLHHLISKALIMWSFPLWGRMQDYVSREEQQLFRDMVGRRSDTYLKWAVGQLSAWKAPELPASTRILQIHGTIDRMLPYRFIRKPDLTIQKGGHFLVHRRASEVADVIMQVARTLEK